VRLNLLALTLTAAIALWPAIAAAQQTSQYNDPAQHPSVQQVPAQQSAPQQTPGTPGFPTQQPSPEQTPMTPASPAQQPSPEQTPMRPASPAQQPSPEQTPMTPASPAQQPSPEQTPAAQAPAGPTMTVEGAVTSVKTSPCGEVSDQTTGPTSGTAAGCVGVVEIAPGVSWAGVVRAQMRDTDAMPITGVPIRVLVAQHSPLQSQNSTTSLMALKQGAIVRIDYQVVNDVPIATDVNVMAMNR
jgi:hypothetical protein